MKYLFFCLLFVSSALGTPGSSLDYLDMYYPEHSHLDGMHVYSAMIFSRLTDTLHPACIVAYKYQIGHEKIKASSLVLYKLAGRMYVIDHQQMRGFEVPFSDATNAIEFYWRECLQENFVRVKILGYKANQYWYN